MYKKVIAARKNNNITSEYSIKGIIPDYINFILVLILGLFFHQKGTDITYFFLIQIALLILCFILTYCLIVVYHLLKALITSETRITPLFLYLMIFCTGFSIMLLLPLHGLLTFNFPVNLVCFPSVLYANRKIFQKLKKSSSESDNVFAKGFLLISCAPFLVLIPRFFNDIGLADAISFFICYSALCFPYKGTFNLLFPQKIKKKVYSFFSNPAKLFGIAWTCFSLVFLFVGCYGGRLDFVLGSIPFICVGIFMLLKWK